MGAVPSGWTNDIVKKEKHQNRWFARVGAEPGGAVRRARGGVCIQVKYTNRMFPIRPGWGAGECMTSRSEARADKRGEDEARARRKRAPYPCPSLDRIKREKGVWWMPWQQEAMKDVIPCDKLGGAGNRP